VSEAVHLDRLLAPLLDWLAAPERRARSVILITGDHGEGWGEHGTFSHASLAWQELVRTPIVLLAPGLAAGDYGQLVSHRDFPATILGAFGLERDTADAERFGRSLLRLMGHEHTALRTAVVCHSSRQASGALGHGPLGIMIDGSMKVVVGVTDGIAELYDLAADPDERTNLATQKPALTAQLARKLNAYLDAEHYPALPPREVRERQLGVH
jgi:arylsulfatase A-like enzyme